MRAFLFGLAGLARERVGLRKLWDNDPKLSSALQYVAAILSVAVQILRLLPCFGLSFAGIWSR
ncbi:hypothetical protein ABIE28_000986 [Devosia sp. 2618]